MSTPRTSRAAAAYKGSPPKKGTADEETRRPTRLRRRARSRDCGHEILLDSDTAKAAAAARARSDARGPGCSREQRRRERPRHAQDATRHARLREQEGARHALACARPGAARARKDLGVGPLLHARRARS